MIATTQTNAHNEIFSADIQNEYEEVVDFPDKT